MVRYKFVSIIVGTISTAGLFVFYVMAMRFLAGSWTAAWWQFKELWYWMILLASGFGVQAGLFYYVKTSVNHGISNKMPAANSAVSIVGMVACCAHHLTDVIPILGLSALSLWLTVYQRPLLIIGIISNLVGIIYLIKAKTLLFLDKPKVV